MSQYYDAFISYGRADSKAFATKLYQDLTKQGFKIWFDQNDIPLAVDFQNQIDDGIERAHNFLFIIGPHSVNSPYCLKEIELAAKYKKRIIPLLHVEQITKEIWQERNPSKTEADWTECQEKGHHCCFQNMHPEISKINWVPFQENVANYDKSLADLIKTVRGHQDYVEKHTQILTKALEWERNKKLTRYLLVGKERQEAEQWLKIEFKNEQPPCLPNDLQCEFICESIKNANNLMTQVFLSYSEKNREMMESVRKYLMRHGITVWTNQTDIKTGSEFQQAINRGIEAADNFVYLLSPESLKSEYCRQELSHAFNLNKRIFSVLIKPTDLEKIPPELQKLQFINLTEEQYHKSLDNLIKELTDDAIYYQKHKVLLVKALKWQEQERNPSLLLRGYNLERYQSWLGIAGKKELHPPIDLQREFIAESAKQPPDLALDVFVSYSRADSDFARRLNEALQTQGKTTWFDQESIATGTDFQAEIYRGIEHSDNFLFVISPDSVNSPYCADEVEYARKLNKRFVTVLHRKVNSENLHPELAKVQWLDFHKHGGDFYANFGELVRALDTDREYVREHTKKSQAALEWKQADKSVDLLLRGNECNRAYEWLQEVEKYNKKPGLTEWLREYIVASKKELERLQQIESDRQQRELRKQRRDKLILSCFLVLMSGLSIFSWFQTVKAQKQSAIALARQLTAESRISTLQEALQQRGTLLAVESMRRFQKLDRPLVSVNDALRNGLSLLPSLVSEMKHDKEVWRVTLSTDGKYIATASEDNTARVWDAKTGREVIKLSHEDAVWAVAFSADGKFLATASEDKTARVWNPSTGKQIAKLDHDGEVAAVSFSTDGKYLATASLDNTARVWEATTGKEVAKLYHDDKVNAVNFSPDGKYLATASEDKTARLWNPTTGKEIAKLSHDGGVLAVAFSTDGKYLATGSFDNTARLWETDTGKEVVKLSHNEGINDGIFDEGVLAVAFSADNRYLATASFDNTARVWETATGKEIAKLYHDNFVADVAFSADGKYLATASYDNTARVWEAGTSKVVAKLYHDSHVTDVVFSANSRYVITTSQDKTARTWDITTGKELVELPHNGQVWTIAFSADGKYLATASGEKTASVWEVSTRKEVARLKSDGELWAVAFSAALKYVATASGGKTTSIWEVSTDKEVAKLSHDDKVKFLEFSVDGKYVATASDDRTVRVWESSTGKELVRLSHDDKVNTLTFSADGKYVATASDDKTARVWEPSTGKELARLNHDENVFAVVLSPDGKYVATVSHDYTARVWEVSTGKEIAMLNENNIISTTAIAFSADSKYVATGSLDGTARVWESSTGKEVAKLHHDNLVSTVVFSPDDRYLATADNKTARVWELSTGNEVAKLYHNDRVLAVSFSPDGPYLATASADNTARLHFFEPEDLINEACRRLRRNLTADEWQRYMNLDLNQYHKTCDNLPVHPSVLARGRELAKGGEVKEAVAIFRRVLELEPDTDLDPDTKEIETDPEAVAGRLAAEN